MHRPHARRRVGAVPAARRPCGTCMASPHDTELSQHCSGASRLRQQGRCTGVRRQRHATSSQPIAGKAQSSPCVSWSDHACLFNWTRCCLFFKNRQHPFIAAVAEGALKHQPRQRRQRLTEPLRVAKLALAEAEGLQSCCCCRRWAGASAAVGWLQATCIPRAAHMRRRWHTCLPTTMAPLKKRTRLRDRWTATVQPGGGAGA